MSNSVGRESLDKEEASKGKLDRLTARLLNANDACAIKLADI